MPRYMVDSRFVPMPERIKAIAYHIPWHGTPRRHKHIFYFFTLFDFSLYRTENFKYGETARLMTVKIRNHFPDVFTATNVNPPNRIQNPRFVGIPHCPCGTVSNMPAESIQGNMSVRAVKHW